MEKTYWDTIRDMENEKAKYSSNEIKNDLRNTEYFDKKYMEIRK